MLLSSVEYIEKKKNRLWRFTPAGIHICLKNNNNTDEFKISGLVLWSTLLPPFSLIRLMSRTTFNEKALVDLESCLRALELGLYYSNLFYPSFKVCRLFDKRFAIYFIQLGWGDYQCSPIAKCAFTKSSVKVMPVTVSTGLAKNVHNCRTVPTWNPAFSTWAYVRH